jgi:hypothetical protein
MTTQTSEKVASSLQYMVINHLKRVYVERSSSATSQILADSDLKLTLELICDHLPDSLQPHIREILALHTLLSGFSLDRYYIERMSETHFVVREHKTDSVEVGPDDPIVRNEISTREDANGYARAMNELQRKLDLEHGRWTKQAAVKTQQEENQG